MVLDADLELPPQLKGSSAQFIGDFYGACMNNAAIAKAGLKPIGPLLKLIEGMEDAGSSKLFLAPAFQRKHEIATRS